MHIARHMDSVYIARYINSMYGCIHVYIHMHDLCVCMCIHVCMHAETCMDAPKSKQ